MVLADIPPDATLYELVSAQVLRSTTRRLADLASLGALGLAGALIWRPGWWFALCALSACFVAYGTWGLAERRLAGLDGDIEALPRALVVARVVSAVIGVAAAVSLPFILVGTQMHGYMH